MLPLRYTGLWSLAGVIGLLLIFIAALLPAEWLPSEWLRSSGGGPGLEHGDKWLHAATFAFLCAWFCGQYPPRGYLRVVAHLALFGLAIELCQAMTGYRSADLLDFLADILGIAVGFTITLLGLGGWSLRIEEWYLRRRAGA